MIQFNLLPLEKMDSRPVIQSGNSNYLQSNANSDILNRFFSLLDSETLASCNLVCKKWHNLTDHQPINDRLWNQVIASEINQCVSYVFGKEEVGSDNLISGILDDTDRGKNT